MYCLLQSLKSTFLRTFSECSGLEVEGTYWVKKKFQKMLILVFEVIMKPLLQTLFIVLFFHFSILCNCLYWLGTFQTTNYGLAGLCETHIDPSGGVMMDNLEITYAENEIKGKGDMIATLMAWLNTPKGKYSFLNFY